LKLDLQNFCDFLKRIFPEFVPDQPIRRDDFATVRMFTVSLLNVLVFDNDELRKKKIKLIEKSAEHIIGCHSSKFNTAHSDLIRKDYNEIFDQSIINNLKIVLRNHYFVIDTDNTLVETDVLFIRNYVTIIKKLAFHYSFSTNNVKKVIKTLSTSNIKVELLCVSNFPKYDEEMFSLLINSINEIKIKKFHIDLTGNYETELRICQQIYEKISNFQTNKIAFDDEFEIKIRGGYRILLEAKLKRGQPLVIINLHYRIIE